MGPEPVEGSARSKSNVLSAPIPRHPFALPAERGAASWAHVMRPLRSPSKGRPELVGRGIVPRTTVFNDVKLNL